MFYVEVSGYGKQYILWLKGIHVSFLRILL